MRRHPWLTAAIIFFVVCGVGFFCFEWRAEKQWQRYAAEARARGVKLLLTDFAQPPIPDEINFAKLPMLQKVFAHPSVDNPLQLPSRNTNRDPIKIFGTTEYLSNIPPSFGDPIKGKPIDWPEWQQYFLDAGYLKEKSGNPVGDVLLALEHYAPEFQQWREWHTRTRYQAPLDLSKGVFLPFSHLSAFQAIERLFVLRLRAHLAAGDSAAAYADFQDGLQAHRALQNEPALIHGLVRISILKMLQSAVGEGCRDRAWADEDYRKIAEDFGGVRLWDDWQLSLTSERATLNTTEERWLTMSMGERATLLSSTMAENLNLRPSRAEAWVVAAIPRGVLRSYQLQQNQYVDTLLQQLDSAKKISFIGGPEPSTTAASAGTIGRISHLFSFTTSGIHAVLEKRYVTLQTALDETRLACALERFRAKRGAYPEQLSELVPDFIAGEPTDLYAGKPYHYQRVGETSFRLYGVGENGTDDGGLIAPGVQEQKQLDAVWPFAPQQRWRKSNAWAETSFRFLDSPARGRGWCAPAL